MDENKYIPSPDEVKNAESMARVSVEKVRKEGSPLERVKLEAQLEAIEMNPAMRKVNLPNEWVDAIRDEHVNIRVAEFEERQKSNPFNLAIEAARAATKDENELTLIGYWEEKGNTARDAMKKAVELDEQRVDIQGGEPLSMEDIMRNSYLMNEMPSGQLSRETDQSISLRLQILDKAWTPGSYPAVIKPTNEALEQTLKSIGALRPEHGLEALTMYPQNVEAKKAPTYYPEMKVANYIPTGLGEGITASVDLDNNRLSICLDASAVAKFIK